MAYEQKDGSCNLFPNKEKNEQHPNWPDLKGEITIDGKAYYVSAWGKKDKNGNKFLSMSVKAKG